MFITVYNVYTSNLEIIMINDDSVIIYSLDMNYNGRAAFCYAYLGKWDECQWMIPSLFTEIQVVEGRIHACLNFILRVCKYSMLRY